MPIIALAFVRLWSSCQAAGCIANYLDRLNSYNVNRARFTECTGVQGCKVNLAFTSIFYIHFSTLKFLRLDV
jgi:hypothetical protein